MIPYCLRIRALRRSAFVSGVSEDERGRLIECGAPGLDPVYVREQLAEALREHHAQHGYRAHQIIRDLAERAGGQS